MCKVGDIIIINSFKNEEGKDVGKHPFVVLSTRNGIIESLSFDMVAILMSSIKNSDHKKKALGYSVNFEVKKEAGAKVDSFAKGNQLYCFQQDNTDYFKVGTVDIDVFMKLNAKIEKLVKARKTQYVITNLENEGDLDLEQQLEL